MSLTKGNILIVDADRNRSAVLGDLLGQGGYQAESVQGLDRALRQMAKRTYDLLICEFNPDELSGLDLLRKVTEVRQDQSVLLLTPPGAVPSATEATRWGGWDFLIRPFHTEDFMAVVQRALDRVRLQAEVACIWRDFSKDYQFSNIIGRSQQMQAIFQVIRRAAEGRVNVLITGESGTGKEMVAKAIHLNSPRREKPFVAVSCAAIPGTLLESELFGHTRGAFTDARMDKRGMFEEAHGGTLFLDEIGEIPMGLQPKLLRAIEEKAVRRLGSTKTASIDLRIVSATNQDLMEEVKDKRFRDDLYYRINELEIHLPPLRSHPEDIPILVDHFLSKHSDAQVQGIIGVTKSAMQILSRYRWPGNIRELENVIKRALTLARIGKITSEDLPSIMTGPQADPAALDQAEADLLPLEDLEREYILRVLKRVGGNKLRAARILKIDRRTLHRKMAKWSGPPKETTPS